jgi:hypothetical protein
MSGCFVVAFLLLLFYCIDDFYTVGCPFLSAAEFDKYVQRAQAEALAAGRTFTLSNPHSREAVQTTGASHLHDNWLRNELILNNALTYR